MAAAADAVRTDGPVTTVNGGVADVRWTALAAPVHIEGNTTGSLVTVALYDAADLDERLDTLAAFASKRVWRSPTPERSRPCATQPRLVDRAAEPRPVP
jgi:hypothetical protein